MYGNWRDWYGLSRWRKQRRYQLQKEPLCRMCAAEGRIVAAEVVDHIKHHEGDWNEFWLGELQSLCRNCHESRKRTIESRGYDTTIGADGMPTDPRHPIYRYGGK